MVRKPSARFAVRLLTSLRQRLAFTLTGFRPSTLLETWEPDLGSGQRRPARFHLLANQSIHLDTGTAVNMITDIPGGGSLPIA